MDLAVGRTIRAQRGPSAVAPAILFPSRLRGRLGGALEGPSLPQPCRTKAEPPPRAWALSRAFLSARPWKRPRQRRLCLARTALFSGPDKGGGFTAAGRMERFSVWIICPQKACGPFASISRTRHPRPSVAFQGSPGGKFPQAPEAGASPGQTAALASDAPAQAPPGLGQVSAPSSLSPPGQGDDLPPGAVAGVLPCEPLGLWASPPPLVSVSFIICNNGR